MSITDARTEASNLLARVNHREDIEETKSQKTSQRLLAPTVKEFAFEFLEKHCKKNKKSWREDHRILTKDILPAIGKLKTRDVKKRDLLRVINKVIDRGSSVMANRVLACMNKLFNIAILLKFLIPVRLPVSPPWQTSNYYCNKSFPVNLYSSAREVFQYINHQPLHWRPITILPGDSDKFSAVSQNNQILTRVSEVKRGKE